MTATLHPHVLRMLQAEMPPPHHGSPEFVVLRARFEAALQRDWQTGDSCQVGSVLVLACTHDTLPSLM